MATVNQQIDALLKRRGNPAPTRPAFKIHSRETGRDISLSSETAALAEAKSRARLDDVGDVFENTSKRGAAKWVLRFWYDSTGVYPAGSHGQAHTRINPVRKPRTVARSVVLVAAKNPGRVNITKRKDTSTQHLQFYVRDVDAGYDVASFFNKKDAVSWGQKYADKTNHNVSVRREDEK